MQLTGDWRGVENTLSISYSLTLCAEYLTFGAQFPPGCRALPSASPACYTPRLWEGDVAELFLGGVNDEYLEVNLAPNAAWWIQGFEAPRERIPSFLPDPYRVETTQKGSEVTLKIQRRPLESFLGKAATWTGNVTAILGKSPQTFLSRVVLAGSEPDFHQPARFLALNALDPHWTQR